MSQFSEMIKSVTKISWLQKLAIEQLIAKKIFPIYINTKYGKYKVSLEKIE